MALRTGRLGVVAVAMFLGALVAPAAAAPRAASTTGTAETAGATSHCAKVFSAHFARELARDFPGQRVTASIYDERTRCWYHLHPKMRITTASVIKAQILGATLLKAQDEHRSLSAYERRNIHPMIRYSFNCPVVCNLYQHDGGVAGQDRFDRRMGATHTSNTAEYGGTWTTAKDRTQISRKLLFGGGPIRSAYRKVAWAYMSHVHPTQQWGITAGVPHGWTVALKNGFYPESGYGWRVGSTGFIRDANGSGYAMTVMTDHDANQYAGIHLVERVTRHATAALTNGSPKPRLVDRAVCVMTYSGESWSQVARKVHAHSAASVRKVSGDNPNPLQGQRACNPALGPLHRSG